MIGWPCAAARGLDHRPAAGRPRASGSRRARRAPPRRAGSGSCRTARAAGGARAASVAAECSTISTRFCRRSSSASVAGLVLMSEISRAEKMCVPSGCGSCSSSVVLVARREGEQVLAQRDHVAVAQPRARRHALAVQQGAVLAAAGRPGRRRSPSAADLRVVAREPLVGQEDVALARAADGDALLVEREALPRAVRALDGDLRHGNAILPRETGAAGAAVSPAGCGAGARRLTAK